VTVLPRKAIVPPVVADVEKIDHKRLWPAAPSLKPGVAVIEQACRHQPEAMAIVESWRFRHPVKTLAREEYTSLIARSEGVVFHG
jgi:hypothetical protein